MANPNPLSAKSVRVLSFDQWMKAVDRAVQQTAGLSVHDLADFCFRAAYDDGASPASVAREVLESEGWEG